MSEERIKCIPELKTRLMTDSCKITDSNIQKIDHKFLSFNIRSNSRPRSKSSNYHDSLRKITNDLRSSQKMQKKSSGSPTYLNQRINTLHTEKSLGNTLKKNEYLDKSSTRIGNNYSTKDFKCNGFLSSRLEYGERYSSLVVGEPKKVLAVPNVNEVKSEIDGLKSNVSIIVENNLDVSRTEAKKREFYKDISYLERTDRKIQSNEGYWLDQINILLKMTRVQNSLKNKLAINIECSYANLFTILLSTGCKYLTLRDYRKVLESFGIKYNFMSVETSFKDIDFDGDGMIYSNDFVNFLKSGNEILQNTITNRHFTKLSQISKVTLEIFKNI